MAYSGPNTGRNVRVGSRLRRFTVGVRRLGFAMIVAAVPALLVTTAAAVRTGFGAGGVRSWVSIAMATPVLRGEGLPWAFHVAALVGLVGMWLLGFALVVEGYYGID